MLNRLAHLSQEHARTQRRTEITQKKAADIFMNKAMNEERMKEQIRVERERVEEEERQRMQNMQMKILSRRETALKLQSI